MLEISSGLLRHLKLRSPTGRQIRPSSEKLRQGSISILRNHICFQNICAVDLFSGSGAWSIEAISNGVKEVWLVESSRSALHVIRHNLSVALRSLESQELTSPKTYVVGKDVRQAYKNIPLCDLIFCDPPYHQHWFEAVLELENKYQKLKPDGILVFEAHKDEFILESSALLKCFNKKNYGDSVLYFFVKQIYV